MWCTVFHDHAYSGITFRQHIASRCLGQNNLPAPAVLRRIFLYGQTVLSSTWSTGGISPRQILALWPDYDMLLVEADSWLYHVPTSGVFFAYCAFLIDDVQEKRVQIQFNSIKFISTFIHHYMSIIIIIHCMFYNEKSKRICRKLNKLIRDIPGITHNQFKNLFSWIQIQFFMNKVLMFHELKHN